MFAGVQMAISPLMSGPATINLLWPEQSAKTLSDEQQAEVGKWFAWQNSAFLAGAATGGLLFGWLGDRAGRTKAMGASILCYTVVTGQMYFCKSPEQLLVLRFISCLGVGGMWPNGVALVAEAWSEVSRPALAGLIGTAANVGIVLMALAGVLFPVREENWRWVVLVGASPLPVGLFALAFLPESPRWLAQRALAHTQPPATPLAEVFRPPLLWLTLIGICLSTVPLFGGWGSGNWLIRWAEQLGTTDPSFKSWTQLSRALGGTIGSFAGGWVASKVGRRPAYFLISLACVLVSEYIYLGLNPLDKTEFLFWVGMVGVAGGLYFGWMPLCLPEMFPTRVRSTGAGVTFNFGRVLSAVGIFGAGLLVKHFLDGTGGKGAAVTAQVGAVTSLIYMLGMIVIWFAPDTSGKRMDE